MTGVILMRLNVPVDENTKVFKDENDTRNHVR